MSQFSLYTAKNEYWLGWMGQTLKAKVIDFRFLDCIGGMNRLYSSNVILTKIQKPIIPFFLFRNKCLTTFEIQEYIDRIEDEALDFDDDVVDPNFRLKGVLESDSDSDSDSDSIKSTGTVDGKGSLEHVDKQEEQEKENGVQDEILIFMDPPIERNDGDTDQDSGNKHMGEDIF